MKAFSQFSISHFERNPDNLEAKFHFHFDQEEYFTEIINLSPLREAESFPLKQQDPDQISAFLAHLHIALGVSYYKLFPTSKIIVETYQLTPDQQQFWHTFYLKGLGEFFYTNQIDPHGLANFESKSNIPFPQPTPTPQSNKALVLFGGGKDSLVSVELLKERGVDFDLFSFGKDYLLHQIAQVPTWAHRLAIQRSLDLPQLQKLHEAGYYNGHVPITGTICFVSLIAAMLYGYDQIITSLEKSADFGNTSYCGLDINHQRSKSLEFETLFNTYVQQNLNGSARVTSLIRDRYEIKVVQNFAQYDQYFNHFSSCNRNFLVASQGITQQKLRCGVCPKCAFIYVLLRAFLPTEKVNQIFGTDMFQNAELITLFKELMGISGIKPFECVGTNEEVILALRLIWQKEAKSDSPIMQIFTGEILPTMQESDFLALQEKLLSPSN